ncbi:hypothetical protein RND81_05G060700 [Saponaria officinalis]|uniref:Uncharacterized protein n=1 Tax=Saponaria officinalis TaxID=3572 RepID=A0AAW1KY21_SAPOF
MSLFYLHNIFPLQLPHNTLTIKTKQNQTHTKLPSFSPPSSYSPIPDLSLPFFSLLRFLSVFLSPNPTPPSDSSSPSVNRSKNSSHQTLSSSLASSLAINDRRYAYTSQSALQRLLAIDLR